jgi:hypothetical protein
VEEQHTATTKQMADIQAKLDELKREKHELFQQLKLVSALGWLEARRYLPVTRAGSWCYK